MNKTFDKLDRTTDIKQNPENSGTLQVPLKQSEVPQTEEENVNTDNIEPVSQDDIMYTDIDLSPMFLGGDVLYTVTIHNSLDVTFKLLSSEELEEVNKILYDLADKPMQVAVAIHGRAILARAIVKYGDTSWKEKSLEDKELLLKKLPSLLVGEITKRFSIFEKSATKMLSDDDYLKN